MRWLVGLLAVAVLAACGGSRGSTGTTSTTAAATTTTEALTTARQVAGIVAKNKGPLLEALDFIENCIGVSGMACFEQESTEARYSRAINLAYHFENELLEALPVEAEVAKLTSQTINDLAAVGNTVQNGKADLGQVELKLRVVRENLAAWDPYL